MEPAKTLAILSLETVKIFRIDAVASRYQMEPYSVEAKKYLSKKRAGAFKWVVTWHDVLRRHSRFIVVQVVIVGSYWTP
jgi:hypothetical protein